MIRILIVEDQNFVRKAITTLLEPESNFLIVGEAENGVKALELINEIDVDIAIVDLDMPEMNGLELTEQIKQNSSQIKVIILSGCEDKHTINKAINAGAKGYLLKGSSTEQEIVDTINSIQHGYFQLGPGLIDKLILSEIKYDKNVSSKSFSATANPKRAFPKLQEEMKRQSQQIRHQLFEELNLELDNLKADLQQGLNNFQDQVSTQIKNGFEDFNSSQSQSQFVPEVWQKRYVNLSQSINFIESRYNLAINKLRQEIALLRYSIIFIILIFIPILVDIFLDFSS